MEFMDEKLAREAKESADQVEWCKNVIRAAEHYERLDVNPDFKHYISDINDSISVVNSNIQALVDKLDQDNNLFKSLRSFNVLTKHAVERNALIYYRDRVKNVIQAGKESRIRLAELTEAKKEATHA